MLTWLHAVPEVTGIHQLSVASITDCFQRSGQYSWLDHTPHNVHRWPLFAKAVEDFRLIHIVRDGRAVFSSVRQLDWGPRTAEAAATWWASEIASGLATEQELGPERSYRVRYEDIVADPSRAMRELCSWLSIAYSDELLSGSGYDKPRYLGRQHDRVGKPPTSTRGLAYRTELPPAARSQFEYYTYNLLTFFGYPVEGLGSVPSSWNKTSDRIRETVYRVALNPVRSASRLVRA